MHTVTTMFYRGELSTAKFGAICIHANTVLAALCPYSPCKPKTFMKENRTNIKTITPLKRKNE